jgi:1-acyl-sn-glycerol-3-phosphate acyltransferase
MAGMFASLPTVLRTPIVVLLIVASTIVHTLPLFLVAFLRWILPGAPGRACARVLIRLAESWIAFNAALVRGFTSTRLEIEGGEGLRHDGHYLVLANHQSWVDIVVLQTVLNRRMPFMRFFLKQQLIWVPFLGLAWWALDFPFMRRASRRELAKRPDLAGRDVEATRRACARFKGMPVAIMNFVEGTRFTPDKHRRQASPYRHLLKPKAGGVGFALEAMDGALHSVVDATLAYPGGIPTLLDLVAGRIPLVRVRIRERPIPSGLQGVDYGADPRSRVQVQRWINAMWLEKDTGLDGMLGQAATVPAGAG